MVEEEEIEGVRAAFQKGANTVAEALTDTTRMHLEGKISLNMYKVMMKAITKDFSDRMGGICDRVHEKANELIAEKNAREGKDLGTLG